MKNVALAAKKALQKKQLRERQEACIYNLLFGKVNAASSSILSSSNFRRTWSVKYFNGEEEWHDWLEWYPWHIVGKSETAIDLFLESINEDLEWMTSEDYFYYLCDFPKYCEGLGIKFPDQFKVGRYGKTLENYDG